MPTVGTGAAGYYAGTVPGKDGWGATTAPNGLVDCPSDLLATGSLSPGCDTGKVTEALDAQSRGRRKGKKFKLAMKQSDSRSINGSRCNAMRCDATRCSFQCSDGTEQQVASYRGALEWLIGEVQHVKNQDAPRRASTCALRTACNTLCSASSESQSRFCYFSLSPFLLLEYH